jgi:hypothetical protein
MQGGTTYTFVTDGIEAALELARAAAGDKNVGIGGGANGGVRLFEDLDPEGIELRRTKFDRDTGRHPFPIRIGERTHVIPDSDFLRRGRREDDRLEIAPPGVVNDDDGHHVPAGRVASPQGQVATLVHDVTHSLDGHLEPHSSLHTSVSRRNRG